MTAMKNMDIDVETETAWVEAEVTVGELDDFTCSRGLVAINGSCTDVGAIGLTLSGGFRFLSRTQGLAVDNCLQPLRANRQTLLLSYLIFGSLELVML